MSSMRNAVQRRAHRERAQPLERQRLGLLEKHKDYALRAKDFNKKKAQLKSLRQKAAERNEDEFYFGMVSRSGPSSFVSKGKRWTGTVDGDRGNKALDVDTVRLLKTQDIGYIRTVRNVVAKEVRVLQEQLILAGGVDGNNGSSSAATDGFDDDDDEDDEAGNGEDGSLIGAITRPKRIVFADGEQERERLLRDLRQGEEPAQGRDDEVEGEESVETEEDTRAQRLAKLRKSLRNAKRKLDALTVAEHELELQRAKMAKTPSYSGITRKGKKVKARERKR
ncbi:hypothetical protein VTK73DRAFT_6554 [Phialemonium thermophilum]|uniref:U3 small nucleolar RNA-associated protein 11 n=1 Tax=Phialemonium thermophilum TaxID=223376 RepID=A0ABR3XW71_9PEZI